MAISEVRSIASSTSYQGQGSSVKAPVTTDNTPKDYSTDSQVVTKDIASVENLREKNDESKNGNSDSSARAASSLKEAVDKINSAGSSCEAVFGIHEGTNRVMIKMVDKNTKEVIKEFPAEETLDLIAKAWDLAGIMVDERR